MNIKIGFVVSEFNNDITSKMLEHAKKHAKSLRVDVKYLCYVPGTFDMPLMIEKLLRKIQSWPGVMRTETQIVLSSYKGINAVLIP